MILRSGVYKVTVSNGGTGYSGDPTVSFTGGGGTGAAAVAEMAGTAIGGVYITNAGTGYESPPTVSFTGGGGTGVAATASVLSYSGTNPICLFKGRGNDLYGVDGYGRGLRWDGDTEYLEPLGISRPASAPTTAVTLGGSSGGVRSITIINGGAGYSSVPQVTFTGGGLTDGSTLHARGRARVRDARVVGITIDDRGRNYSSTPQISFSGGIGSSGSVAVVSVGFLDEVSVVAGGSGYTSTPNITGDAVIPFTADTSSGYLSATGLTDGDTVHVIARTGGTEISIASHSVTSAAGGTFLLLDDLGATVPATAITAGVLSFSSNGGYIQVVNHGLTDGSTTIFSALSGGAGITSGVQYYVTSAGSDKFRISATSGGSPVWFTTAITAGQARIPPPVVTIHNAQGLTDARVEVIAEDGQITTALVPAAGTGATTSGQTISVTGGAGSGATLAPKLAYAVSSITITSAGTGYLAPPAIGFRPIDGGASAIASVTNGSLSGVTVLAPGRYSEPPTAVIEPTEAKAIAYVTQPILGRYRCCIRYLDDTTTERDGPIPSSISDLHTAEIETEGSVLTWKWSNAEAEARVHQIELWRTTADQQLVLYRVAILDRVDGELPKEYTDTLSDNDLLDATRTGFGILPIVLTNGQLNARRFQPPRTTCSQACVFQDRAWYTADTTGDKPNSIWHSEVDAPESAPELYEMILQENHGDSDAIVSLRPFGSQLLVFQSRHLYSIQYITQPLIDASIQLAAYRGVLNPRCHDAYDGVLFAADSTGMYAYDGQQIDTFSVAVDNYWRDSIIDFSKSSSFFVRVNPSERVVRFYYCQTGDSLAYPTRALCFCISTKAWWEEVYDGQRTAAVECMIGGRVTPLTVGIDFHRQSVGESDSGGTPFLYRTGPNRLDAGPSRSVGVLYTPAPETLALRTHYNDSDSPRPNAVAADRGSGFVTTLGSTEASLNMASDRSPLGTAPGYAKAYLSGRANDFSAGGDKHMAIAIAGSKTGSDPLVVHTITIEGVQE